MFIAPGIGSVTLINKKDRPVAIFSIDAVMGNVSIGLKELNPPLILKAMEAATVEIEPVSKRHLGDDVYEWKLPRGEPAEINIYLSTSFKTIKCHRDGPPSHMGFAIKRGLRSVTNSREKFNGIIYNDNARYALVYTEDKKQKTSLISKGGFISWDFLPNMLQPAHMQNTKTVRTAILATGLEPLISPFVVEDLQNQRGRIRTPRTKQ